MTAAAAPTSYTAEAFAQKAVHQWETGRGAILSRHSTKFTFNAREVVQISGVPGDAIVVLPAQAPQADILAHMTGLFSRILNPCNLKVAAVVGGFGFTRLGDHDISLLPTGKLRLTISELIAHQPVAVPTPFPTPTIPVPPLVAAEAPSAPTSTPAEPASAATASPAVEALAAAMGQPAQAVLNAASAATPPGAQSFMTWLTERFSTFFSFLYKWVCCERVT